MANEEIEAIPVVVALLWREGQEWKEPTGFGYKREIAMCREIQGKDTLKGSAHFYPVFDGSVHRRSNEIGARARRASPLVPTLSVETRGVARLALPALRSVVWNVTHVGFMPVAGIGEAHIKELPVPLAICPIDFEQLQFEFEVPASLGFIVMPDPSQPPA